MNRVIEFSAKIQLDSGEIVEVGSEPVETEQPNAGIEYAEDGYSVERRFGVCVRSQAYDAFLDDKLANGDEYEKAVAENATRWFCMYLPTREYTDEQLDLIKANYMNGYVFTMSNQVIFHGFYPVPEQREEGFATVIRYFDRFQVHKHFLDGAKYSFNNKAAHNRQNANPGIPKPIAS